LIEDEVFGEDMLILGAKLFLGLEPFAGIMPEVVVVFLDG
jgi:hypothetical protein